MDYILWVNSLSFRRGQTQKKSDLLQDFSVNPQQDLLEKQQNKKKKKTYQMINEMILEKPCGPPLQIVNR